MNRRSGMQKYAGWGILSGVFFGSMGGTSCLPESCTGADTTGSFSPAYGRMIFARAKKRDADYRHLNVTCDRRFELPTFWSVARRSIQLS